MDYKYPILGYYFLYRYFDAVKKSLHSRQHKILLETLYDLRQKSGLTQSELAACLQVPQSFVSKYENGERRLDLIELAAICDCLHIDLSQLVYEYQKRLHEAKF